METDLWPVSVPGSVGLSSFRVLPALLHHHPRSPALDIEFTLIPCSFPRPHMRRRALWPARPDPGVLPPCKTVHKDRDRLSGETRLNSSSVTVHPQMLIALESYYWRYCSASELVNMILAFMETRWTSGSASSEILKHPPRSLAIFHNPHFLDLSETMVTMIMARNLEIPEIHKFEAMLKWAKNYIKNQGYQNKSDAKADFRACMDRLSRDLKLYRISPQVKHLEPFSV